MLNFGAGKLLLVDDKQENLLALSAVLGDEGYELIQALSGIEAIQHAHDHEFIAILLDVQMPELDGFQTAQLIRQGSKNQRTPIIFVTALHRSEEYEKKGYVAGAVDYLFKPINTEILKAKVAIFSELYQHKREIQYQAQLLREKTLKEKENEMLKESLKARDQFLSMASHELKTPITPLNLQMQAFLQMIENESFQSSDPERIKRMLQTSYSQIERLSKTIDNLLDVSRFTSGQMELKVELVDLEKLIQKILNSFSAQLQEVGCSVTLAVRSNALGYWDPFRIEQIFINLISNSMKYGAGSPIIVTVDKDDRNAIFQVKDHGIGIAPMDQQRIFNRFERAASPDFYSGMGLGLYISSEITRLHHGTIEVQSESGQGAAFTVKLPL